MTTAGRSFVLPATMLVATLIAAVCPAPADDATGLQKNDRLVFLGDSITAGGVRPDGYVTLISQAIASKHPDLGIEVIGAGISGHKVPDCQQRLERDVLAKKPTAVVIYIGINDVWHWNRNAGTPKDKFESGLRELIERSRAAGARVVLCTPSVIGERNDGANEYDAMLDEYAAISRKVAAESSIPLVDLRKAFQEHLKRHNPDNAEKGILTTDGVHLNPAGNRFVADCLLATLCGQDHAAEGKLLRHVVMFKFKSSSTDEQIQAIETAFAALPGKIDAIADFECGTDVSVEGKSQGYTHCFLVSFRDEQGRAAYLPHPAHKEFGALVGPHVEQVLVFDYWTAAD